MHDEMGVVKSSIGSDDCIEVLQISCPLFTEPEKYLSNCNGRLVSGFIKRIPERRAIDRCTVQEHRL